MAATELYFVAVALVPTNGLLAKWCSDATVSLAPESTMADTCSYTSWMLVQIRNPVEPAFA